jgi:multiple sugar transport system substrate-binding protein
MHMTIYGGCPDVSEIGSTWINDFASMSVLRPFTTIEVRNLGSAGTFVPSTWQSSVLSGTVWAIPWFTDLSLVYYRRDLLAKAGVEEAGAFQTPKQFEQTLQQLQEAGIPVPWVVPTLRTYINIHNLAMWVWQAGEDFVDKDGKTVLLNRSGVRSAILSFLRLYRFIPKELHHLGDHEADQAFNDGKAAVVIGGPWNIVRSAKTPQVTENLGLAIPLGCSYIGGSNLVIWEQTPQASAALEVIAHLTSREFQTAIPKLIGLLPGRLDSLDAFPLPNPDLFPILLQAIQTGRSLPNLGLWGLIEDRLVNALAKMWEDILDNPRPDLEALYDQHISPLSNRLNITLSES